MERSWRRWLIPAWRCHEQAALAQNQVLLAHSLAQAQDGHRAAEGVDGGGVRQGETEPAHVLAVPHGHGREQGDVQVPNTILSKGHPLSSGQS